MIIELSTATNGINDFTTLFTSKWQYEFLHFHPFFSDGGLKKMLFASCPIRLKTVFNLVLLRHL